MRSREYFLRASMGTCHQNQTVVIGTAINSLVRHASIAALQQVSKHAGSASITECYQYTRG